MRANHIQARAIKRCGDLLREIERDQKSGRPRKNGGDAPTVITRCGIVKTSIKQRGILSLRVTLSANESCPAFPQSE